MKIEIKVLLPTGEDVLFSLEEARELYATLKDIFEKK